MVSVFVNVGVTQLHADIEYEYGQQSQIHQL